MGDRLDTDYTLTRQEEEDLVSSIHEIPPVVERCSIDFSSRHSASSSRNSTTAK